MNKLRKAFQEVHAEEELVSSAKDFLEQNRKEPGSQKRKRALTFAAACAALILTLTGGSVFYFTPVYAIGIDVNPSLEIGVNRFDQVVTVSGYGAESEELVGSLNLKYHSYEDALNLLMSSPTIVSCLNSGEEAIITVVSEDGGSVQRIVDTISCQRYVQQGNVECRMQDSKNLDEAHASGMSVGKYEMYVQLAAYDASLTPEKVQQMTMKQLRRLLQSYEGASSEMHGRGQDRYQ
ncbi:MAG: hypothetical protein EOM64_06000 [Erysipelotrichia bacterium]|nr:hypothetical protein [Erysipelotrichia bacterium]